MAKDKVFKKRIKGLSDECIEVLNNPIISSFTSSFQVIKFVADENTKKYMKDLGLDNNPREWGKYLIESAFSAIDEIFNSIDKIEINNINGLLAEWKAIRQKIKHRLGSADERKKLADYQDELIVLRNKLEKIVSENIQEIVKIDKMSSYRRKIKAAFIKNKVDLYTKSAKVCLQGVMEIAKLQSDIANYIEDDNFSKIQDDIDEFMNKEVFCGNNISLMNDWSIKEYRDYWSDELREQYAQIRGNHGKLLESFNTKKVAEEQKVDLEDTIFK